VKYPVFRQFYQDHEKGRVFCSVLSQKTGDFLLFSVSATRVLITTINIITIIYVIIFEQVGLIGKDYDFYSEDGRFEFRPGHRLF
jgi:hypothetical protein